MGASIVAGSRPSEHRSELDAIRLLVVVGLVFFHAGLVFDSRDDFYVKNDQTTEATTIAAGLAVVWAMPMLFFIAGLGARVSLGHRSVRDFMAARALRLGVPLLVAILTIVPIPPWLRLRTEEPERHETYWQFLPAFFNVHLDLADFPFIIDGRYFETGHLWFVVLLLTFSLMLAAGVAWAPRGPAREAVCTFARIARRRRGGILIPALPLAGLSVVLGLEEDLAGWSRWAYLAFFLLGFATAADDRFRLAMRRDAVVAAVLGLALFTASAPAFMSLDDPFTSMTPLAMWGRLVFGAAGWCWVVAILGLLDRRRGRSLVHGSSAGRPERRAFYGFLLAAALPIYVLHQPIVVSVAYWVVTWEGSMATKYVVIVLLSFAAILVAHGLLVRITAVTGRLLGLRGDSRQPAGASEVGPDA